MGDLQTLAQQLFNMRSEMTEKQGRTQDFISGGAGAYGERSSASL